MITRTLRVPSRLATASDGCDHHQVFALPGGIEPKFSTVVPIPRKHRTHAHRQLGGTFGDDSLLLRVVERASQGADLERPDEVCRRAAVGSPHETVALEPAQVSRYGHLRKPGSREPAC